VAIIEEEADTETDSEIEIEADSEIYKPGNQEGEVATTDSKTNDDNDDAIEDDMEEADTKTDSEIKIEANSEIYKSDTQEGELAITDSETDDDSEDEIDDDMEEADTETENDSLWSRKICAEAIENIEAGKVIYKSVDAIRASIKAVSEYNDKNIKPKSRLVEVLICQYATYAETLTNTKRIKINYPECMHPEFMSISQKLKEIVASTIDDITSVVMEALTEPESDEGSDAEPDSESDDGSDVDTETEPIKTPSPKTNLVSAGHAADDIGRNTQTNVRMETETEVESTEAIDAPSLSSMIMDTDIYTEPEPQLVDKLLRCEDEDVYKMYSQSQDRAMFKNHLIVLLTGTTLKEMEATRRELTNEKTISFMTVLNKNHCPFRSPCKNYYYCKFQHEDSPWCEQDKDCADQDCQFQHHGAVLARKVIDYCHFFNNRSLCKKGNNCKFRHEDSPRCGQDKDCADQICQFKHTGAVFARKAIDYCHFFNNRSLCKKGNNCKFRHEDSPRCERDKDCEVRVCQFKHNGA